MKKWLFFLLLIASGLVSAQTDKKGVGVLAPSTVHRPPSTVRAVVVGISNYSDPGIPDLQFADRDAMAFADWLKSPAGGKLSEDNILLLTNEKATNAQIGLALYWLIDSSVEGDEAIIYFSGHGDLDSKKLREQWGYLLTYDTPAAIYSAGAYPLNMLQNIVSTLSIDQKVKVELFLDACHAGKLAGSQIGGGQATAQTLAQQFANEIKVLSCQPKEFSIEGKQWGNGRGVFSFHLINGLSGLADKNNDRSVSLLEIGRYLQDIVPEETAQTQLPMTVGDQRTILALVDAFTIDSIRNMKTGNGIYSVLPKGVEDDVLSKAGAVDSLKYIAFKNALKAGNLLESEPATAIRNSQSANLLFKQLLQNETFKPLFGVMRRNFAAALADDAQQALNAILSDDPFEINTWTLNPAKYKQYPLYLERALELIGEKNYLYRSLLAKKLYFEGYNIFHNLGALEDRPAVRDSFRLVAQKAFLKCLEYEPGAAYAAYSLGEVMEKSNLAVADSNIVWFKKAIELAPNWKQPYVNIADLYLNWLSEPDQANEWLSKAYVLDSTSYFVLQEISWLRQYQHLPEEANAICRKMIALRPELPNAYYTMGHTLLFLQGAVQESEKYLQKGKMLDLTAGRGICLMDNPPCPVYNMLKTRRMREALACLDTLLTREDLSSCTRGTQLMLRTKALVQMRDFDRAAATIQKAEQMFTDIGMLTNLESDKGRMLFLQGRFSEAEKTLRYALTLDGTPNDSWVEIWALLGCVKGAQNQLAEAEQLFKKAVSLPGGNTVNYFWEEAWFHYGQFLLAQNRDAEALQAFEKTEEVYPNGYFAPYGQALWAAKKGDKTAALDWLEKSLDRYYPIPQPIYEEPLFAKIRKTKRFKVLMVNNFPQYQASKN